MKISKFVDIKLIAIYNYPERKLEKMNNFYVITTVNFFDDKFAYCQPTNDAEYGPNYPRCPECGSPIGSLFWQEPRKIILSKPRYGDFICGNDFLVSENFKDAYEKSNLKGIKRFIPVTISKVRYMGKKSPSPPLYYTIELIYSFARVNLIKSVIKGQRDDRYCKLCSPFLCTKDKINGIFIDDRNWGGDDIFHLHEMGSSMYASQKFVDFCLKNKFTNFMYENTHDYKT